MALEIMQSPAGVTFHVKVVPGSSRTRIAGLLDTALKVNLASPPEKGRANKELLRFLTDALHLPKNAASLVAGPAQSRKQIHLAGLTSAQLLQALAPYLE
jgi:uncharacterized protein